MSTPLLSVCGRYPSSASEDECDSVAGEVPVLLSVLEMCLCGVIQDPLIFFCVVSAQRARPEVIRKQSIPLTGLVG